MNAAILIALLALLGVQAEQSSLPGGGPNTWNIARATGEAGATRDTTHDGFQETSYDLSLLQSCLADKTCSEALAAASGSVTSQWHQQHRSDADALNIASDLGRAQHQAWPHPVKEPKSGEQASLRLKGIAGLVLLSEAVAGMYLPLLLQRLRSPQWWLSLLNCFSGGIFLSAGIIHLLPHCAEAQEAMGPIGPNGGDYPLYLVLIVVGYCVVFYVERVLFDVHGEGHAHCQHSNVFTHSSYYKAISHSQKLAHLPVAFRTSSGGDTAACRHASSTLEQPPNTLPAAIVLTLERGGEPGAAATCQGLSDPGAAGLLCLPDVLSTQQHQHRHHHQHSHSHEQRHKQHNGCGKARAFGAGPANPRSSCHVAAVAAARSSDVSLVADDVEEAAAEAVALGTEDAESCHSMHSPRAVCVCVEEPLDQEAEGTHAHHHQHGAHHRQGHHHHNGHRAGHGNRNRRLNGSSGGSAGGASINPLQVPLLESSPSGASAGCGADGSSSARGLHGPEGQLQQAPGALLASCRYHAHPHAHPHPSHRQRSTCYSHDHGHIQPHYIDDGATDGDAASTPQSSSPSTPHCNHHHHDHHHRHAHALHHPLLPPPTPSGTGHSHVIKPRFRFMHGVVLLVALALHTALECIALGLADERREFLVLFAAIASHKAVSALALSSRFLKEGASMIQVTMYVGPFCFVAPLSILAGVYAGRVAPLVRFVASCFATGTFLYVGASEVIMEEFEGEMRADRRDISTRAARYIKFCAVLAAVALVAASGLLPEPDHD